MSIDTFFIYVIMKLIYRLARTIDGLILQVAQKVATNPMEVSIAKIARRSTKNNVRTIIHYRLARITNWKPQHVQMALHAIQ